MTPEEHFARLTTFPVADSLKRRSIRGSLYSMAGEGMDFFLRLASISILARLLLPEHFGLISMVTAITAIAERFKDLGLSTATVRQPEISHRQVSTLFWINTAVGAGVMCVVAASAYPISWFYGDARLVPITLGLASSFLWSGASIQHLALLRRQMRFASVTMVTVTANVLSIVVAIIVAANGGTYWALVLREVLRSLTMAVGTWICFPWLPGRPSREAGVGSMLRFGGDMTAFNIVYFLSTTLDQVLIGKLFGAGSLGVYRQGYYLVFTPLSQIMYPISSVSEAALSRLQHDAEKYRRYYRKILTALSLLTMPFSLFIVVYAQELVLVVLGQEWIAATEIFRILGIAVFLRPASSTAGFVMVTCGKSRRLFWLGMLTSVTLVSCFFIGARWGIAGVAYAHVASFYLLFVPKLYWSFEDTPITVRMFIDAITRPLVASVLLCACLYAIKSAGLVHGALPNLVLGTLLSAPIYIALLCGLPGGFAELKELTEDIGTNVVGATPWLRRKSATLAGTAD